MRKLVESTYVSLDGMVSGGEFWAAQGQYRDDTHVAYAAKLLEAADALVLGRATYEVFAESWPGQTGDLADRINLLPKYVASRTLTNPTWNAEILEGDAGRQAQGVRRRHPAEVRHRLVQPGPSRRRRAGRAAPVGVPLHRGVRRALLPGLTTTHLDLAEVTELGNGCVVLTYTPKQ